MFGLEGSSKTMIALVIAIIIIIISVIGFAIYAAKQQAKKNDIKKQIAQLEAQVETERSSNQQASSNQQEDEQKIKKMTEQIASLNQSLVEANATIQADPTSKTTAELVSAAKYYYDNMGPLKDTYDMIPQQSKIVDEYSVDIMFANAKSGSTDPVGYDSRRFTYALDKNNKAYVITIGGAGSGQLTNEHVPVQSQIDINTIPDPALMSLVKNYFDSKSTFSDNHTFIGKELKRATKSHVDVFYKFYDKSKSEIGGVDSRRFTVVSDSGAADSGAAYVSVMGGFKSGLLTNALMSDQLNPTEFGLTALTNAAKKYYTEFSEFKGQHTITVLEIKIVNATQADIYYTYSSNGMYDDGADYRRFTYAVNSGQLTATCMGDHMSGLLAKPVKFIKHVNLINWTLDQILQAAKQFYNTESESAGSVMLPKKINKVEKNQADILYDYKQPDSESIAGSDYRRFYFISVNSELTVHAMGSAGSGTSVKPIDLSEHTSDQIQQAAKLYYDTKSKFADTFSMLVRSSNNVNTCQADVLYNFAKSGTTESLGTDYRRFTFQLVDNVLTVSFMDDVGSGITVKPSIKSGVYTMQHLINRRFMNAQQSGSFNAVTLPEQADSSQQWILNKIGTDLYTIQHSVNKRYLDATNAANGYAVITSLLKDSLSQKWIIKRIGTSTFSIQNSQSKRYLDSVNSGEFKLFTNDSPTDTAKQWILQDHIQHFQSDPGYKPINHFSTDYSVSKHTAGITGVEGMINWQF